MVTSDAQHYFSDAEQQQIDAAVAEAERHTDGEIVPVLASRSGRYDRPPFLVAIWAALIGTALVIAIHSVAAFTGGHAVASTFDDQGEPWGQVLLTALGAPLYVLLPVQIATFLAGYFSARSWPALWKAFIPHEELESEVHRAAREAFAHFKMCDTRDASGIMIYVSLFERMVVVVADQAINAKHDPETWDVVRDLVVDGFRKGHAADGFLAGIRECGRILAEDFPKSTGDENQLANHLRIF